MPKTLIIFIVVILLLAEAYLVFAYFTEDYNRKRENRDFCETSCKFNQNSYMWESLTEGPARGFTTQEECVNYCIRSRDGFSKIISQYGSAFLSGAGEKLFRKK